MDWPTRKEKRGGASVPYGQQKTPQGLTYGAWWGIPMSVAGEGGKEKEKSEKETQGEVA